MATSIRFAGPGDAATLLRFIQGLAEYEREPGTVEVTAQRLKEQLAAPRPPFECLLAEEDGTAMGYALFFQTYSTWRGCPGIWLEDLYVPPEVRGRGHGRALVEWLAQVAVERGCARIEWSVLDWNEPAQGFYRDLGAAPLDGWRIWRLTGEALDHLGGR